MDRFRRRPPSIGLSARRGASASAWLVGCGLVWLALSGHPAGALPPPLGSATSLPSSPVEAPPWALPPSAVLDPAVRAERTAGLPGAGGDADVDAETARRRAQAYLAASAWLEQAGDAGAAADATARALSLDAGRLEDWFSLGRNRMAAGDPAQAEAAWLRALDAPGADGPAGVAPLLALADLYVRSGRWSEAGAALDAARSRDPADPRSLDALFRWLVSPAPRPAPAAVEAAPPPVDWRARVRAWPADGARLLDEMAVGWVSRLSEPWRGHADALRLWFHPAPAQRLGAVALGLLVIALVAPRWLRQRGDLAVALRYPEELRGTFRLRLARKRGRLRDRSDDVSPETARTEVRKGGISSRTEHHLVSRETHFPRLATRRYFVLVEGVLEDPDSGEVLSDVREMKVVRVRHRRTVRCEFDLRPRHCPVDLRVTWDGAPPRDVLIACEGLAGGPRSVVGGSARIELPKGRHTLVVGCGDRVLEQEIEVQSHQPSPIAIDVAAAAGQVFRGCPPAVEPFLRGDLAGAAAALERDGQHEAAHRVLARGALEKGRLAEAAEHWREAGLLRQAAELWEQLGEATRAAELYQAADDPLRAARIYREAGELVRAGEAFESGRDFDSAIECYAQAGELSRQIDALDRRGDTFAAAQIALDNGWRARGIRLLRLVTPDNPHFGEACTLLADAFEREGHWDLAAQKLEEHIHAVGSGEASPDLTWRLAELLENAGHLERALGLLEELRRREPTYPNVASRIDLLRKKRSAMQTSTSIGESSRSGSGDFAPPTMFLSDYRYEILEEVGRGAMGVVFRARDRRLSRVVALKRLPDTLRNYPRAVQLFLREAQATARLNHPNIVTVYDADQEDGAFFITMELLEGEPLHHRLREVGRLDPLEVARLGVQVAAGLEYAHGRGVVHRDVKTANLFLTRDGQVKIMDFGLAKMLEEVRRAETGIGGTPFYMAPEQVAGQEVDARADLYALGATLYELAAGRVPFPDGDVTYHHRHTAPPDPREFVPDLPSALADLILQLLSKDPGLRPPSADAVRQRLDAMTRDLLAPS